MNPMPPSAPAATRSANASGGALPRCAMRSDSQPNAAMPTILPTGSATSTPQNAGESCRAAPRGWRRAPPRTRTAAARSRSPTARARAAPAAPAAAPSRGRATTPAIVACTPDRYTSTHVVIASSTSSDGDRHAAPRVELPAQDAERDDRDRRSGERRDVHAVGEEHRDEDDADDVVEDREREEEHPQRRRQSLAEDRQNAEGEGDVGRRRDRPPRRRIRSPRERRGRSRSARARRRPRRSRAAAPCERS